MTKTNEMATDVLIIGAGPAGLTAAAAIAAAMPRQVLVVDREAEAGGIPRHSDHLGYGIRDQRRFISGPAYARRLTAQAVLAGATILTQTMVTGWAGDKSVEITSPRGRQRITARAIILATGARERPRPARLIPGDRVPGVLTTGQLQNLVHLHHRSPGTRAVVVGAELVSWSAVMTLRKAGCKPVLMTSLHHTGDAYAAFTIPGRFALRVPLSTRTRVARIIGHTRVEAVEIENLDTGMRQAVACDTVVLTGDWIPDNELARSAGLEFDEYTRGPLVDTAQCTSAPGIFAIGNLTHPVDTADVAALDGREVAQQVLAHLTPANSPGVTRRGLRIQPGTHLFWVSPGRISPSVSPPRDRILAWPTHYVRFPSVSVRQGDQIVVRRRLPWPASPGRVLRIPFGLLAGSQPAGEPVTIDIA